MVFKAAPRSSERLIVWRYHRLGFPCPFGHRQTLDLPMIEEHAERRLPLDAADP
jgi:hypothetical protein